VSFSKLLPHFYFEWDSPTYVTSLLTLLSPLLSSSILPSFPFQKKKKKKMLGNLAVAAAAACAPQQRYINYMATPSEMMISWATSCQAGAVVNYGVDSSNLNMTTTGPSPKTYTIQSYTSPYLYHVPLSGLVPGVKYYYTVGDSTSGVSPVASFFAHPGVGPNVKNADGSDFTIAVIGDLGQTTNSESTRDHVLAGASDMVMQWVKGVYSNSFSL